MREDIKKVAITDELVDAVLNGLCPGWQDSKDEYCRKAAIFSARSILLAHADLQEDQEDDAGESNRDSDDTPIKIVEMFSDHEKLTTKKIKSLFKENLDVDIEVKLIHKDITNLINTGIIERAERGVYKLVEKYKK